MEYITLKNSQLRVSRLCMGGCPMGQYGWGHVQKQELVDAVHTAMEHGVNFYDTADTYGLGTAEETLGEALGSHRTDVIIAGKFGVRVTERGTVYDNSPQWIKAALEESLRRLKREYIDVYQMHYWDGVTPPEEIIGTLESLRGEGKLRYFGLSNLTKAEQPLFQPYSGRFVSLQDEYSLARREHERDLTELAAALAVTPMTWGSLGQGVLTGKYRRDAVFPADDRRSREAYVNFHDKKLLKNLEIVEAMRPIAQRHNVCVAAVALRFILDRLSGSVVLVGAKRPAQVLDNLQAVDWMLSEEELRQLDAVSREGAEEA